jgi:hypothetical protein
MRFEKVQIMSKTIGTPELLLWMLGTDLKYIFPLTRPDSLMVRLHGNGVLLHVSVEPFYQRDIEGEEGEEWTQYTSPSMVHIMMNQPWMSLFDQNGPENLGSQQFSLHLTNLLPSGRSFRFPEPEQIQILFWLLPGRQESESGCR